MEYEPAEGVADPDPGETREWLDALDDLVRRSSPTRATFILERLVNYGRSKGLTLGSLTNTPYINTIPAKDEPPYPGDLEIERRIRSYLRWNAAAMVIRANKRYPNIGGHLSTYASAAALFEVGFNHFFKGRDHPDGPDHVFFQGHASPGIYARAYLEGRLSEEDLDRFRREVGGGLSSYPHPRLMPHFWENSTVSMGLGPLIAAHQAYFDRYLAQRHLKDTKGSITWCFCGDGELDEPEAYSAIGLAGREGLDNLIFVVNCNLQRLDGPVRGNGKIIQELEARFKGAGWNVIKVIWGSRWDPLLERDVEGKLVARMEQAVDGDYQLYATKPGSFIRQHFFGVDPYLLELVKDLSDDDLASLPRGGHDVRKIYAAYKAAVEHEGQPTVVLAKTVKGWRLGPKIEARNAAHAVKTMGKDDLVEFRDRLGLTDVIPDEALEDGVPPYVRFEEGSAAHRYLVEHRQRLGGFVPERRFSRVVVRPPRTDPFKDLLEGSKTPASTTQALARLLRNLTRDPELGPLVVPIVPDEGRSFGLETLFSEVKIYSPRGQRYVPVDADLLLAYRESEEGQVLEEGISEADAMASFIAAGTSYATWDRPMIPFYLFYSMFGFQRVGDLIWAAADQRARGFLIGTTAGRTTYNGEGLQHQDGHSHLFALSVPSVRAYDPAFAYELAFIVQDGIESMVGDRQEDVMYYVTTYNETYPMPAAPSLEPELREAVLKGLYRWRATEGAQAEVALIFSGTMWQSAAAAAELLATDFGVPAELWSLTSVKALREDALACQRMRRLGMQAPSPHLAECAAAMPASIVAVSDFMAALFHTLSPFLPSSKRVLALGTEGFGRSDTREVLRRFFEVDAAHVVLAALALARDSTYVAKAADLYGVPREGIPPWER